MNIEDVDPVMIPSSLKEAADNIWKRQIELESSYTDIEHRPQLGNPINTRNGQVLIKDFLWRITEEVGETLEAMDNGEKREKVWEELADGLHFVVGLAIHAEHLSSWNGAFELRMPLMSMTYQTAVVNFVKCAGILGNTLKLKPWKQTDVLTDEIAFNNNLTFMIIAYLQVCWSLGMRHRELYDYYMRKSEVNLFRIRSRY